MAATATWAQMRACQILRAGSCASAVTNAVESRAQCAAKEGEECALDEDWVRIFL